MEKKIAVINFSGNVGKSTITKYLLSPRLNNATIISVETVNASELDDESLKGKQFTELLEHMAVSDDFIADIGASNAEDFLEQMFKLKGSHEWFNYFVIPVSPKPKQQQDTISTIRVLSANKVPKNKIRVIFNMVDDIDELDKTFNAIIEEHAESKSFSMNKNAVIMESEFYLKNKDSGKSIQDILNDERDFKKLIRDSSDNIEKVALVNEMVIKMLAAGVNDELDAAFSALFSK